jgi:Fe2+ transport system protein FeoA
MKCSYCGKNFDLSTAIKQCEKCHKSSTCSLARCPYCYYEFVVEPKWFNKLFKKSRNKNQSPNECNIMKLNDIKRGMKVRISDILSDDVKSRRKIMAMGLLPGVIVELIQQYPTIVIKAGESQFAIDSEIASLIEVEIFKN